MISEEALEELDANRARAPDKLPTSLVKVRQDGRALWREAC